MKLLQCFQTHSTCYLNTTRNSKPIGILFHDTAAGNPTIKRYVQPYKGEANYDEMIKLLGKNAYGNDWNHSERQAGLNAWIGKLADGSVATVQSMPWDFQPWGCGRGNKGSCNGWNGMHYLQFEICDDSYKDKAYFEKIYKEACEFAAYICKTYGIDPKGTVQYAGVSVPTILCHADSYKLGLGSNHGDVYPWFNKFGKNMQTVRDDVYTIMHKDDTPTNKSLYRVRKSWADSKSQIGAYSVLENAKKACDDAGAGYYVFDESGKTIYPIQASTPSADFKEGDVVKLVSGATYTSGGSIPSWVFSSTLYVRGFRDDGVIISTLKTGAITGVVAKKFLTKESGSSSDKEPAPKPVDDPYKTFVKAVQSACGAKVDGIAGPETLAKTVTLSTLWNKKHKVVKAVQTYLIALGYSMPKYGADGSYGPETKEAVKAFQRKNGCSVDGVITAKNLTWKKLLKLA